MNPTIGTYCGYDLAIDAMTRLKDFGYSGEHLTLLGLLSTGTLNSRDVGHPDPVIPIWQNADNFFQATFGTLSRIGMLAIPGVGFLFGAGALAGAIAGFDLGLVSGGIGIMLDAIGLKHNAAESYIEALLDGKYLVIVQGSVEDIRKSKAILNIHGA